MFEFLIYLLVLLLVFGSLYYAITLLPLPQPFLNVVTVVLIVLFVLVLLGVVTGQVPMMKFSVRS